MGSRPRAEQFEEHEVDWILTDSERKRMAKAYSKAMRSAEERFAPLIVAMQARGWDRRDLQVWQTGGMVMCLAVVLARTVGDGLAELVSRLGESDDGLAIAWVLVGDPRDDHEIGGCLDVDEDKMQGTVENFASGICVKGDGFTANEAIEVAEWLDAKCRGLRASLRGRGRSA